VLFVSCTVQPFSFSFREDEQRLWSSEQPKVVFRDKKDEETMQAHCERNVTENPTQIAGY